MTESDDLRWEREIFLIDLGNSVFTTLSIQKIYKHSRFATQKNTGRGENTHSPSNLPALSGMIMNFGEDILKIKFKLVQN